MLVRDPKIIILDPFMDVDVRLDLVQVWYTIYLLPLFVLVRYFP